MNIKRWLSSVSNSYDHVKQSLQRTTPTKYNRILNYLNNLSQTIQVKNKNDRDSVEELHEIAEGLISKLQKYYKLNLFLYCLIYFSFVSFFMRDVFLLSEIAIIVSKVVGIVGTTFFFFALYFSNKIIDLYYQDLNLVTSHIISIYTKHQKEIVDNPTTSQQNYYAAFIKFIKEKY